MKINNNNNNKIKTVKLKQIALDNVSIYTLFGGSKSLARVCWNFHANTEGEGLGDLVTCGYVR